MLVDLGRNDIGRISETLLSVQVTRKYMEIELFHMSLHLTNVVKDVASELTAMDASYANWTLWNCY